MQRIVFYGCELYAGQLKTGDRYAALHPVYSICLVNGILGRRRPGDHAFRLADGESGRVLQGTLEIHTLELGRYNLRESELLGQHARLLAVLALARPRVRVRGTDGAAAAARDTARDGNARQDCTNQRGQSDVRLTRESDSRPEMGIRLCLSRRQNRRQIEGKIEGKIEGRIEGKIELIRAQGILQTSVSEEQELRAMTLEQLESLTSSLQEQLRNRTPS